MTRQRERCRHRGAVMLGCPRITRVANNLRGWMYRMHCTCGTQLPIEWPLGRKANDTRAAMLEVRAARVAAVAKELTYGLAWLDAFASARRNDVWRLAHVITTHDTEGL